MYKAEETHALQAVLFATVSSTDQRMENSAPFIPEICTFVTAIGFFRDRQLSEKIR